MSIRRTLGFEPDAGEPQIADVLREMKALREQVQDLTGAVDRLLVGQKQDGKWRMIFRKQLMALVRANYLTSGLPAEQALSLRRFRLRSQNEEDGIVLALMQATGIESRTFVEIGCGGTGGNSAVLAYELGWRGLMVDASKRAITVAEDLFRGHPQVSVVRKRVEPSSINKTLKRHGFVGAVDFLSIDVDSIDYWLLEAVDVTARVLVMEYNAHFGPERAVTVPDGPWPESTPKGYSGASLAALDKCAQRKGYRLVLCEDAGVNAFFVRADLAPQIPTLTPAQAWRPLENKFDASGEGTRQKDIFAEIERQGLPLVEV